LRKVFKKKDIKKIVLKERILKGGLLSFVDLLNIERIGLEKRFY